VLFDISSSLLNVLGLTGLTSVQELYFDNNQSLQDLNGLVNITYSSGRLWIANHDNLLNIDGLSNITHVSYIEIAQNPVSSDINALDNITSINYWINISSNNSIENLDGLTNISTVGETLNVTGNENLVDLCGLQTLLIGNGLDGPYQVSSNAYNPTQQDIIDGNCSL